MPAIAWLYDDRAVALFSLLQTSAILVVAIFSMQLDQAFAREFYESPDRSRLFATTVLPGLLVLTLFFSAILIYGAITKDSIWVICATILAAVSIHCVNFSLLFKRMEGDRFGYVLNLIGPKIILLAVVLIGPIFSSDIAAAYVAASLAAALVSIHSTRLHWGKLSMNALTAIRPLLKLSLPLVPATVVFAAIPVTDRYAILWLSGEADLAAYAMAATVAGLASLGSVVFGAIWTPTLYRWAADNKAEALVKKVSQFLPLGFAAAFLLIGCAAYVVPTLLPPSYASIKYFIPAAAAYPLLYIASEVTGCGIGVSRRTAYAFLPALLGLTVSILLHLVLTKSHGAPGAATASSVGYFVFFLARTEVSNWVWRRLNHWRLYCVSASCIAWSSLVALSPYTIDDFTIISGWIILLIVSAALSKEILFPNKK